MMQISSNREATADFSKVYGTVSSKENGFINITKFVVVISVFLALLMIVLM